MNKRLAIISVTTIALLLTGSVTYAVVNKDDTKANVVTTQEKQVAPPVSEVKAEETTVAETAPVQTTPTVQTVVPEPVYRTFDQIIADYSNMSSTPEIVECSHVIQRAFPYRFTPEKAEVNIKLVSTHYGNACAAAFRGTDFMMEDYQMRPPLYLRDRDGTGDFWQKNGGL